MLKEGDIIELYENEKVYYSFPEHFRFDNRVGSWELTHGEIIIEDVFGFLAGKYVVTKTVEDGGETGCGPFESYPNGWHVFCEKIDNRDIKVDFYQSGGFTAKLPDKKAIGRAELTWKIL